MNTYGRKFTKGIIFSAMLLPATLCSGRENVMPERLERAFSEHVELTSESFRRSIEGKKERFADIMRRLNRSEGEREELLHEARAIFERLEQMRDQIDDAKRDCPPAGNDALRAEMRRMEAEHRERMERAEQEHRRHMERAEQEFRRRVEELKHAAEMQRDRQRAGEHERVTHAEGIARGDREHAEARERGDEGGKSERPEEGEREREGDRVRERERGPVTEREAHEAADRERKQRMDRVQNRR